MPSQAAQVIVCAGRRTAKRQLADRFQDAIDRAAMRSGAHGTNAYLADWRRGSSVPCGGNCEASAAAAAARLDTDYDLDRLDRLVHADGHEGRQ